MEGTSSFLAPRAPASVHDAGSALLSLIHEAGVEAEGRGGQGLGLEDARTHAQLQLCQSLLCYSGLVSSLWSLGFPICKMGVMIPTS